MHKSFVLCFIKFYIISRKIQHHIRQKIYGYNNHANEEKKGLCFILYYYNTLFFLDN